MSTFQVYFYSTILSISQVNLARRIHETERLAGSFQLRSGVISHEYFDKYLFEANPQLLLEIAQSLLLVLPSDVEAIAGLEMGGIPIATLLSQLSGLPTLFVRKAVT